MKKYSLNGIWKLKGGEYDTQGNVPGSVYSILLENGLMDDPYYRDNESKSLAIADNEFVFSKTFNYKKSAKNITLVCEGLDTICDLYLNGKPIAHTENMHRTYRIDVSDALIDGENEIEAVFCSADKYVKECQNKRMVLAMGIPLKGWSHIRKAHCMMGWDWGPRLPDAGIWRDIYLLEEDTPYISDVRILQRHKDGKVFLTVKAESNKECDIKITVIAPNGEKTALKNGSETEIHNPLLWWPHGYGKQYLYTVRCETSMNGKVLDCNEKRVGLRTLTICKEEDEWGESFCHEVNGVKIFAMGADYVPEDNILSRITKERTEKLLKQCVYANFNAIRVWGGGFYPHDYFFELCDELGIIVFFDLMFACASYPYGEEFNENVKNELFDNLKRIRHHACLGVISGNNEIEQFVITCKWPDEVRKGYLEFFEGFIPEIMKEVCPEIPFVTSSPSSGGNFNDTFNENKGDSHFWGVWFANLPFTEYRNHFFRYLSEFGMQSFPSYKTIEEFTEPKDRNIFSRIMETHQRSNGANGRILLYLSQTYLYPKNLELLVYASQLLQSESMKYAVEHLRRNRGRCMGTLYWQLNDIWPVASWSSIDGKGRYKALQYEAKRFYSPILISCKDTGEYTVRKEVTDERCIGYETKAELYVQNETMNDVDGKVVWKLFKSDGTELQSGKEDLKVNALSVAHIDEIDFKKTDVKSSYLWFAYEVNGETVSSGTVIFTKPKHFDFVDPELKATVNGDEITVTSKAYAKYVAITNENDDLILSDNYFDMNKGQTKVKIISGKPNNLKIKSVFDIR